MLIRIKHMKSYILISYWINRYRGMQKYKEKSQRIRKKTSKIGKKHQKKIKEKIQKN